MRLAGIAVLLGLPFLLAACPKKNTATTEGDAASTAASDGGSEGGAGEDDVEPVYPIEPNAPPVPLATKLCVGLTEMPEKKRSACCNIAPGIVVTTECVRTLSAALRYKAVEIAEPDVDKCLAAFGKTLEGCDWVGPFAPGPPPECMGILKGKLAAGAKCRSSLECSGDLRCLGVGPTTPGKCGPAKATGEVCGGTVDTLATYVRQNDLDKQHPECKEKCIKHKCAPPSGEGGGCQTSGDCQEGLQCLPAPGGAPKVGVPQKKCTAKDIPKEGEPCPGGVCQGELQCIKNKCAARKPTGQECTNDFECKGGCLKPDAGDKGKCGPRCDIR
jgi:hypothetical protein